MAGKQLLTDFEYVDKSGQRCPFCHSDSVEVNGTFDPENGTIPVECNECDATWYDYYQLAGWIAR